LYDGNGTSGHPAIAAGVDSDLAVRLRALGHSVSPTEISDLWVFPPLPDLEDSGDFVLFTRVLPDEMRRVCRVEFADPVVTNGNGQQANGRNGNGNGVAGNGRAAGNGNGNGTSVAAHGHDSETPVAHITEYGRVPSKRVQRVVDGFRRRLGDDREPLHIRVDGCPDSWLQALAREPSEG
jgi:hypothetical protein